VVVGPRTAVPEQRLTAGEASWLIDEPMEPLRCLVQCRSSQPPAPAIVTPLPDRRFEARFTGEADDLPDDAALSPGAISPGQAAVVYANERVLGGGWIE
jgi:tRNA-specific 2-thiouridylase